MTAVILAMAAGLAATVLAQGPRMGHGRHGGGMDMLPRMTKALNLTDAQQAQIKSIMQAERAKIQPLMQQLHQNEQAQNAAVTGTFDEAKTQSFAAGQAQLMSSLIVEKQRAKSQIYAVLTPEQQQKAQTLLQQRGQRRQEWMQKHQPKQVPPTTEQ
ncbi:MAG TPA: Spy/CpxP family protein refolding chaperone [Candidatus Angelobacter sp.]